MQVRILLKIQLLEASDILITDYSNTMFEAALAEKYVFLYINDKKVYEIDLLNNILLVFDFDKLVHKEQFFLFLINHTVSESGF